MLENTDVSSLETSGFDGSLWEHILQCRRLALQAKDKVDESLHLLTICHLTVKLYFTNISHLWHYAAMTNMEMLFKTALYLNQFLAQCLTAGLCQGTMPATQGKAALSKQPEHQCRSQGLNDQIDLPSHSSFQLQPGWVTQKSQVCKSVLLYFTTD